MMKSLKYLFSTFSQPNLARFWLFGIDKYWKEKELPKRAPLDWRENPKPNVHNKDLPSVEHLDRAFKKLYLGSPTFRALITAHPAINTIRSSFAQRKGGSFNLGSKEISLTDKVLETDPDLLLTVYMLSHEYRHVSQYLRKAGMFGSLVSPQHFPTLYHATESDSYVFSIICTLEVMAHEGFTLNDSIEKLSSHVCGTSLNPFVALLDKETPESLPEDFNRCAQSAFQSYFDINNPDKAFYDEKIRKEILRRTAYLIDVKDIKRIKYPIVLGGLTPDLEVYTRKEARKRATDFSASFMRLGYFPFFNKDGSISDFSYLDGVDPHSFAPK